jgi:wobble nucleotide-excising tRNase
VISRLQLLRNIGQFDNVSTSATLDLKRLTLIYAENGRGKTTLAAVLRSLGSGEALPITERRRLGAAHPPEAIIACTGATQPARFQNGVWSRTCPDVLVFDDVFVNRNVYSGLDVAPDHRQNLHELILGDQGVTLARRVDDLATQIRNHNAEIRNKSTAIPATERQGLTVDDFCALPDRPNVDNAIIEAEQRLAALRQANAVQTTAEFASLSLPVIESTEIANLLGQTVADLDASAVAAVKDHFGSLGGGAEGWVAAGMTYIPGGVDAAANAKCPFCRRELEASQVFSHYRAYFGEAYKRLQAELAATQTRLETTLAGDALAGFERQVSTAEERQRFWSSLCAVPEIELDTTAIAREWQTVRIGLSLALKAKRADPLTFVTLNEDTQRAVATYATVSALVAEKSRRLLAANENIQRVKEATQAGNVQATELEVKRLKATKARHTPATAALCTAYLTEKSAKEQAERDKETAQQALNTHRDTVFPAYQAAINTYLVRFNAGFSIEKVQPQNTAGRPSCTYEVVLNSHRVPVTSGTAAPGSPAFKNTMSGGDRNSLALAFFFACLDRDPRRASRIVVLDDPISSLDEHRCIATIQETRGLVAQVAQVCVLSHSKAFLARIWQHADQPNTACLTVARDGLGSTLAAWDVTEESITEYDKRHARLREYMASNTGNTREVAQSIRPVLEGYLRIASPEFFPPGQLLGPFRGIAQQRAVSGTPIVDATKLTELGHLTEYSNRFHHDTNPAWDSEHINDGELQGFVRRTLEFVRI